MDPSAIGSNTSKMQKIKRGTLQDFCTPCPIIKSGKNRKSKLCESDYSTSIKYAHPTPLRLIKRDNENNDETAEPITMSLSQVRYNMNHKNRGKCVIFKTFQTTIEKPEGYKQDVMRLQKSFTRLGFNIEVRKNSNYANIMNEIKNLSKLDHTDNDCLCVILLIRDFQKDSLWRTDAVYTLDNIWKPFTADKCKTLAGKPKLFFIQIYKGNKSAKSGDVIRAPCSTTRQAKEGMKYFYTIPIHPDFLIVQSMISDLVSWKKPTYVQCLCNILDKYGKVKELMDILTLTTQKFVMDRISHNDENAIINVWEQVPLVTSLLIRSLYFLSNEE